MTTKKPSFYLKTNRVFNDFKKISWIFVPLIAFGGLFYPKLGLLLLPIMITLMTLGFLKGKYWCGNLCPHGSLFDRLVLPLSLNKKIPAFLTSRFLKVSFFAFYMTMFTSRVIKVSSTWGTLEFWDKLGFVFAANYMMPTILGTTLALFVSTRAWCSFCPMSTMEQLMYKLGKLTKLNVKTDKKVTIAATELCHKCGKCSRVCPMQLKPYQEFSSNNQFDNENCIRCTTCVVNCPAGILSMANGEEAKKIKEAVSTEGYQERQKIVAKVEKVAPLKPDVTEYTFKFIKPEKLEYKAGQFILVKILKDAPEMFRAYSISSYNEDGTRLSVTIKKLQDGFGTNIISQNFKVGDLVELEGPLGRELVVDKEASQVLLVAGGIGITPFVPIVQDLLKNPNDSLQEIKLIYGVNKEDEFLYDEVFRELAQQHKNFAYIKTVAFPEISWQGQRGFVTDAMKEVEIKGSKVYLCGPLSMVKATKKFLQEHDVEEKDIFAESA